MAFILGTISIIAFMAYFYAIGFWYVGFIPLLVFVVSVVYYISGISFKQKGKDILQKYGLLVAWVLVMIGVLGVLRFFDVSMLSSLLNIVSLNILIWLGSYIFNYKDGKIIAQFGYYFSILGLLVYAWAVYGFDVFFGVFTMSWILSLSIITFIIFLLGIRYEIEQYMQYKLFALIVGTAGLILYRQIKNIYIFLLIGVLALGLIYTYIHHILSHKPPTDSEIKEISVRRILAGERVLKNKTPDGVRSHKVYLFIDHIPLALKYFLEGANMLIMLLLIYLYFQNALSLQGNIEQVFYRLTTAGFIVNVFLLKKINYTSVLQRLLTFIVINFAIYISLFSAFRGNIGQIAFLGIIRNIFCAMMVFHIHKTRIGNYLHKMDYLFWVFTTILALVVNLVLLFHTNIVGQLLFPTILLYIGIQGMILFYSIKYINKIQEIKAI